MGWFDAVNEGKLLNSHDLLAEGATWELAPKSLAVAFPMTRTREEHVAMMNAMLPAFKGLTMTVDALTGSGLEWAARVHSEAEHVQLGPYSNEYVFWFTFSEDELKFAHVVEMLDSDHTLKFFATPE